MVRAPSTTSAPCSASSSEMSRPMPGPMPDTSATLPSTNPFTDPHMTSVHMTSMTRAKRSICSTYSCAAAAAEPHLHLVDAHRLVVGDLPADAVDVAGQGGLAEVPLRARVAEEERPHDRPDGELAVAAGRRAQLVDAGDGVGHVRLGGALRAASRRPAARPGAGPPATSRRPRSAGPPGLHRQGLLAEAAADQPNSSPTRPGCRRWPRRSAGPARRTGTPSTSNSASTWPAPTPRTTRPPESSSSVAKALAVTSGWR